MDNPMKPKTIDEYLDQLCVWNKVLTPDESEELRQEMRAHLEAIVQFQEEAGDTHEHALEWALKQFGDPNVLGHQVLKDALRTKRINAAFRLGRQAIGLALLAGVSFLTHIYFGSGFRHTQDWTVLVLYGGIYGVALTCWNEFFIGTKSTKRQSVEEFDQSFQKQLRIGRRIAIPQDPRRLEIEKRRAKEQAEPLSRLNGWFFFRNAVFLTVLFMLPMGPIHAFGLYFWAMAFVQNLLRPLVQQMKLKLS